MREIKLNSVYKHFKGHYYYVMYVGKDTETLKEVVVYRRLEDLEKQIWVRPLEMFLSEVDHEKYPDVKQKYRFELYEF